MQANGTDEPAQDVLMRSGMLVKNDKVAPMIVFASG